MYVCLSVCLSVYGSGRLSFLARTLDIESIREKHQPFPLSLPSKKGLSHYNIVSLINVSQYAKIARLATVEDGDKTPASCMELASDMEGVEEGDVNLQAVQNAVI